MAKLLSSGAALTFWELSGPTSAFRSQRYVFWHPCTATGRTNCASRGSHSLILMSFSRTTFPLASSAQSKSTRSVLTTSSLSTTWRTPTTIIRRRCRSLLVSTRPVQRHQSIATILFVPCIKIPRKILWTCKTLLSSRWWHAVM